MTWEINEKNSGKFHFRFSSLINALAWEVLTAKFFFMNQQLTFDPAFNLDKHCPSKISLWEEMRTWVYGKVTE